MIITIDTTQELSDSDKSILRTLLGHASSAPATAADAEKPTESKAPAPAKKAAAPAKKAAAPKPKPEPEPEPEVEDDTEAVEEDDDTDLLGTDGPTMEDAVALATKLVNGGEAARVKAALADAGAKRVSELGEDDIAQFVETLS